MREKLKAALCRVLDKDSVRDIDLIINLMSAAAYLFAYPKKASLEDYDTIKQGYRMLSEKGGIE